MNIRTHFSSNYIDYWRNYPNESYCIIIFNTLDPLSRSSLLLIVPLIHSASKQGFHSCSPEASFCKTLGIYLSIPLLGFRILILSSAWSARWWVCFHLPKLDSNLYRSIERGGTIIHSHTGRWHSTPSLPSRSSESPSSIMRLIEIFSFHESQMS